LGWKVIFAVAGIVVVISGPSMLLAYMKLRKRNLGPLLDANGWAINTPVKINVPFGAALTHLCKMPVGAERSTEDPYAVEPSPWIGKIKKYVKRAKVLIILAILVFIAYFAIDRDFVSFEAKKTMYKLLGRPEPTMPAPAPAPVTPPVAAPAPAAVEKAK
jgi:hypothetical protein